MKLYINTKNKGKKNIIMPYTIYIFENIHISSLNLSAIPVI